MRIIYSKLCTLVDPLTRLLGESLVHPVVLSLEMRKRQSRGPQSPFSDCSIPDDCFKNRSVSELSLYASGCSHFLSDE